MKRVIEKDHHQSPSYIRSLYFVYYEGQKEKRCDLETEEVGRHVGEAVWLGSEWSCFPHVFKHLVPIAGGILEATEP